LAPWITVFECIFFQAQTFAKVLEANTDGSDDRALTAMGILNTLETICSVMEEQKEVVGQILALSILGQLQLTI
jgi:hypothetical protein